VIAGPQADHFADSEVAAFFDGKYAIGASDRMAIRLNGRPLRHSRGFDIASDGIAAGSIQIPGNGQPIILSADRQTTGGYPKIATVISADLPSLGRLPNGARVSFEAVTVEAAAAARKDHVAELAAIKSKIVPLRRKGADFAARLHQNNLISGFVSAV
jgi:allophanate hydrolase